MKKLFLIFSFAVQALIVVAQVSVEARIDSVEMMMGEQVHVTLTVTAPEGAKIVFPQYKRAQMLTPGVEVLETRMEDDRVKRLLTR